MSSRIGVLQIGVFQGSDRPGRIIESVSV